MGSIYMLREVRRYEMVYSSLKYSDGFYGLYASKLRAAKAIAEWLVEKKYGTTDGYSKLICRVARYIFRAMKVEDEQW